MTEREPFLYPGKRMALLRRVGRLTVDELHALDAAVRELAATKAHKHVDKGFMFAWWEGPHINGDEELELQGLFSAILVALASGLSGIDVEKVGAQFAPKPSISESIFRLMLPASPSRRLQDASIGLIEATLAPWDPRRAIVATWNMACAAALRERLRPTTIEALEAAWRTALGEPPI
jgi:hypothetical protein